MTNTPSSPIESAHVHLPLKGNGRMARELSAIAKHHPYPKWQLRSRPVRSNLIRRSPLLT